ncbi:hypothetical protein RM572_06390 [Streptomyces sp. DSM 42041]|uniref:Uncharacterized protein n=1 Tax=Streptomyces hazeniae TaxID=3075538 RepID=A0ABU2NNT4_9ACTN|nr:hypothetical protein [Streptomyces sp. DSM 42041]
MASTFRRPTTIPFVVSRQGEEAVTVDYLEADEYGLHYVDETALDRDSERVLWARCTFNLTNDGDLRGRPDFASLHPFRQRACMEKLLCQVCVPRVKNLPTTNELGTLFIVPPGVEKEYGLEGAVTSHPPLCVPHAQQSMRECPHLAKGAQAVRARKPQLWGVHGVVYKKRDDGLAPIEKLSSAIPYGNPVLPWMLASQMYMRLGGVTVVDLETEASRASNHVPATFSRR